MEQNAKHTILFTGCADIATTAREFFQDAVCAYDPKVQADAIARRSACLNTLIQAYNAMTFPEPKAGAL